MALSKLEINEIGNCFAANAQRLIDVAGSCMAKGPIWDPKVQVFSVGGSDSVARWYWRDANASDPGQGPFENAIHAGLNALRHGAFSRAMLNKYFGKQDVNTVLSQLSTYEKYFASTDGISLCKYGDQTAKILMKYDISNFEMVKVSGLVCVRSHGRQPVVLDVDEGADVFGTFLIDGSTEVEVLVGTFLTMEEAQLFALQLQDRLRLRLHYPATAF